MDASRYWKKVVLSITSSTNVSYGWRRHKEAYFSNDREKNTWGRRVVALAFNESKLHAYSPVAYMLPVTHASAAREVGSHRGSQKRILRQSRSWTNLLLTHSGYSKKVACLFSKTCSAILAWLSWECLLTCALLSYMCTQKLSLCSFAAFWGHVSRVKELRPAYCEDAKAGDPAAAADNFCS